jgi:hypothetical protein
MNEIYLPKIDNKTILKAIVVMVYTMIGASTATIPVHAMKFKQFPSELIPHLETPACILIGVVLLFGIVLGAKGKVSASWAVIAYGALSVSLLKYMATAHWYAQDLIAQRWVGMGIATLLVGLLIAVGLHAAYHGRWKQMVAWSLLIHLGLFFYTPTVLYAQHFYCQRHDLLHKAK